MSKPWYTRVYDYLAAYTDGTPTLIVATPLVSNDPPKPLTIIVPARHVTAVIAKISEPRPGTGKKALVVEGKGRKRSVRKARKR
jgi:hypothetical protein